MTVWTGLNYLINKFIYLLDNNIYLHQHTVQYIINKLPQIYLGKVRF